MYVDIELDKPRRLRYDIPNVKALEAAMNGRPLGTILDDLSRMSMTALTLALFHGLKADDPTLNPKLIDRILQDYLDAGGTLDAVFQKVKEALDASNLFRTKEDLSGNAQPERAVAG